MSELAITIMTAFLLGWFCAVSSGFLFGYLIFRTKKEQHERLFPTQHKRKKGPITIDEFADDSTEESGLPDVIQKMNARMGAELSMSGLKKEK